MTRKESVRPATLSSRGSLPSWVVSLLAGLVAAMAFSVLADPGLLIGRASGQGAVLALAAAATVLPEVLLAGLIVIAATGWGRLALGRILPGRADWRLRGATYMLGGLWLMMMAVLLPGLAGLLLPGWLCWVIVAAGAVLAGWLGRGRLAGLQRPRRLGGASLLWVAVGAAAGIWLAGAVRPPGLIAMPDAYDTLSYHLQLPREFIHLGRVATLDHNVYSHYPLGMEMLYLLAMQLRGGPWPGLTLAVLLHGAMLVPAILALLSLPGRLWSRTSIALLVTTPAVLYLSWLAFVELAMLSSLLVALLWLRVWLESPSSSSALAVGLPAGLACGVKYLALPFLAGPLLAVMLLASLRDGHRLKTWLLAAAVTAVLMSPWLVRNAAATGNPVFPLATSLLGRGDWPAQSATRWDVGHGPADAPPVPTPAGWTAPQRPARAELAWRNSVGSEFIGPLTLLAAAVSFCVLAAMPKTFARQRWGWCLAGIVVIQVAGWLALAHDLPWRFLSPAIAPVILLAGWGLDKLAGLRGTDFSSEPAGLAWGRWAWAAAVVVLVGWNLFATAAVFVRASRARPVQLLPVARMTRYLLPYSIASALGDEARVMLVGDAAGLYYPPDTILATPFDPHPLAALADRPGGEIVSALRGRGVTHVLVYWPEVWRLAATYGLEAPLAEGLYHRRQAGLGPDLPVLARLRQAGAKRQAIPAIEPHAPPAPYPPEAPWQPYTLPAGWPIATLIALRPPEAGPDWDPAPLTLPDSRTPVPIDPKDTP